MYEIFTERAQRVMQLANQEGKRLGQECISSALILLGILKLNDGGSCAVLRHLNIDPQSAIPALEEKIKVDVGVSTADKLPQTPRAKKVIEYAMDEARILHHNYVGTEHLLLGLLREEEGVAATYLVLCFGLSLDLVRRAVQEIASPNVTLTADSTKQSAAGQILLDLLTDTSATADEVSHMLTILCRSSDTLPPPGLSGIACTIARQQVVSLLQTIVESNRNQSKHQ